MIHQEKNSGSRTSNIVKSRKSYSNGHLPYHHSFYYLVHASMHDVEMLVWLSSVLMLLNTLRQTTSFNKVTILQLFYSSVDKLVKNSSQKILLAYWWPFVGQQLIKCWPINAQHFVVGMNDLFAVHCHFIAAWLLPIYRYHAAQQLADRLPLPTNKMGAIVHYYW